MMHHVKTSRILLQRVMMNGGNKSNNMTLTRRVQRPLFDSNYSTTTVQSMGVQKETNVQPWRDPAMRQYMFWNREENAKEQGKFSYLIDFSPESVTTEAKILSLSANNDAANQALQQGPLPTGARLLGTGTTVDDFVKYEQQSPNVLFVSPSCPRAAQVLPTVLEAFPSIQWVHYRSAGIDFVASEELIARNAARPDLRMTNAKGQFSSSLAEYVMLACSYFAKDLPRLMAQQQNKEWIKYDVEELRGKTLGIIGYGDIGRAVAKLGSVFGMRIIALRRHPYLSRPDDPYCNTIYDRSAESRNRLMSEADYIVCSAPSTVETRGMINADAFEAVKPGAVFINLGRGPVVDDAALIAALRSGKLKGAALDVFSHEPLPADSPYWDLPNILISPHNMDQTSTFMHEATEFFVRENLPRFMVGEDLLNPVDPELGY